MCLKTNNMLPNNAQAANCSRLHIIANITAITSHLLSFLLSGEVLAWWSVWSFLLSGEVLAWWSVWSFLLSGEVLAWWSVWSFLLSGEVLAWLSVWIEVQMICIWSSWCHSHPIISSTGKIHNGLPFWCQLTQVILGLGYLGKRTLNRCNVVAVVVLAQFWDSKMQHLW